MNTLTKNFLIVTILSLGTLGLGGIAKIVYANQSKQNIPVTPQPQANNPNKTQEASDGDGEVDDATEPPEKVKQSENDKNDHNEADEGANDSDGGAKEDN